VGSLDSDVAMSPRNAFSLAMRGGWKVVAADEKCLKEAVVVDIFSRGAGLDLGEELNLFFLNGSRVLVVVADKGMQMITRD